MRNKKPGCSIPNGGTCLLWGSYKKKHGRSFGTPAQKGSATGVAGCIFKASHRAHSFSRPVNAHHKCTYTWFSPFDFLEGPRCCRVSWFMFLSFLERPRFMLGPPSMPSDHEQRQKHNLYNRAVCEEDRHDCH